VGLATHVRLALARGEVAAALQHAAEAKTLMRDDHGFEEGENVIRLAEIEAFEAAGDHVAARRAAVIAIQRLEVRATKLQEPWRSRFLAKPVNRATLARRPSAPPPPGCP
jgi:hypothetical protein